MLFTRFKHSFRLLLLLLSTLIIVSCGSGDGETIINESATGTAQLRLVFEDDFGGPVTAGRLAAKTAVSVDNWRPETGYGPNSDGWGNNEWQLYTDSSDNLYVENGSLVLEARCDTAPNCNSRDGTITSAKINTKDKLEVKYGVIQARIKVPDGQGMWPAFWMLGKNFPEQDWPDVGEIDIMEMLLQNSDNQTTHFSTHWAGPDDAPTSANCSGVRGAANPTTESENCFTSFKTLDEPLGNEFRVYEVDWDKDRIIGKVDGVTYFTQTIDPATMEEFQAKFYLLLSLAVGGNAAGAPDATTTWPQRMLVDWVRVFEKPQPTAGTLISETEKNIPFVRIYNSVEFGGNTAITNLNSTAVTPLEGTKVMEVNYAITKTGNPGATNALFGGPFFGFTRTDLSDFTTFRFSIDISAYPGFVDNMVIEFKDSSDRLVQVPLSDFTPTENGNWLSYAIPLSAFAGVDITDMLFVGLLNPRNVDDELIAGTLYFDDIRFTTEACTAVGSVAFDSINYNPSTNVASVSVDDICAANSLATVKITAGLDEIVVGVDLDAAGQGETNFGLINPQSVCSSSDQLGYIALEAPFIATYTRSFINDGGVQQVNTATATAAIDENAPGTSIAGNKSYIYATSEPADFAIDNDFNLSDFSTGSSFDFNFTGDARFSPAFQVNQSANTIGVVAFFNFTAGFAASAETFNFKVKGVPNNFIDIKFGDPASNFPVNLQSDSGDGWFEVSIPMSEFGDVGQNTFVQFTSDNTSSTSFSYLITDIFLQDSASSVPAECETLIVPPVPGSGTGDTGASGGDFSVSFDDPAVTYGFIGFGAPDTITVLANDPEKPTNLVAQTTKPASAATFAGVTVEPVPGITYPLSATNNEMSIRIYAPGAGVTVRMKLEDSAIGANFVEADAVTTVDTGWETLTFTFATVPAFTYDKLTLFFGFGEVGDGTVYTWDTIEFLGTVTPPPVGGELLTNGTFEAGDTSGWGLVANNGTFTATMDQAASGSWSGNLVASVPAGGGDASFPLATQVGLAVGSVTPGQTVNVSFDLCGTTSGDGNVFESFLLSEIENDGGASAAPNLFGAIPLTETWTNYQTSVTAGADVTGGITLQLKATCGAVPGCGINAYIDNVSVTLGSDIGNVSNAGGSCAAPPPPPPPVELVTDGSFDAAFLDNWTGQGGIVVETDSVYAATVVNPGAIFSTNLSQQIALVTDEVYTLSFRAKASVERTMFAAIGDAENPFTAVGETVNLTTGWKNYSYTLTAAGVAAATRRVLFDMGDQVGTVSIDNVSVVGSAGELVSDGGFDAAFADNWTGQGGIVTDSENVYEATVVNPGTIFSTNLSQQIALVTDEVYTLSFRAKASVVRTMFAAIGDAENPFTAVGETVNLTTDWQNYSYSITATNVAAATRRVLFDMGDQVGTINIDDVSVLGADGNAGGPGGGDELAVNGDFEAGSLDNWASFPTGNSTFTLETVNPNGGAFAARLQNLQPGSAAIIKQANVGIGVVSPGQEIAISFAARGSTNAGGVAFAEFFSEIDPEGVSASVLLGGAPLTLNADPNVWTPFNFTVNAGPDVSGGVTLQLTATTGGDAASTADIFYDDISITVTSP